MTLIQKITTLIFLPLEQKLWFIACLFGSLIGLLAIHTVPMRHLSTFMGQHHKNHRLSMLASPEQALKARRIANIMRSVAKNVPWPCQCLPQALCVKWLLARYGIPSVFFLGAKIDDTHKLNMQAHAWVSVGRYVVIGREGHKSYQVTATFVSPAINAGALCH